VAFSLFGKLGLRVGHSDMFRESLHSNIVSVLLHLNDSDKDVRNVSQLNLKVNSFFRYVHKHLKISNLHSLLLNLQLLFKKNSQMKVLSINMLDFWKILAKLWPYLFLIVQIIIHWMPWIILKVNRLWLEQTLLIWLDS
jgi:hypothetical protein